MSNVWNFLWLFNFISLIKLYEYWFRIKRALEVLQCNLIFYRWQNWGPLRLNDLPKVIQVLCDRGKVWTQVFSLQIQSLTSSQILYLYTTDHLWVFLSLPILTMSVQNLSAILLVYCNSIPFLSQFSQSVSQSTFSTCLLHARRYSMLGTQEDTKDSLCS